MFQIGVAVALIGFGVSKIPNNGLAGAVIIVIGGVVALVGAMGI